MPYLYGIHAVKAALLHPSAKLEELYVVVNRSDERCQELLELAKAANVQVSRPQASELQALLGVSLTSIDKHHYYQGVAAKCAQLPQHTEDTLEQLCDSLAEDALFLVLDGVQDPQNLGACLRTANAMGVVAVIAPKNRAVGLTPTVLKVASGAASMIPFIQVTNLARTLRDMQQHGVWLYGADSKASNTISEVDMLRKLAIVMGGEGSGLRRLTSELCDQLISIPHYGDIASLNVSVATAICLYEVRRQQNANTRVT